MSEDANVQLKQPKKDGEGATLEKDHLLRAVYELSHDLGNLLAVIHGRGELIALKLEKDHPALVHLDHLQNAVSRTHPLVDKLKALGRKTIYNPESINLNELVEELKPMMQRIVSMDATVTLSTDPGMPEILADRQQLEQSIAHICMMAREYMQDKGELHINSVVEELDNAPVIDTDEPVSGKFASIHIGYCGRSLNQPEIEQLLNPALARSRPLKVFGMGFDKVRFFVTHHNGFVALNSSPGKGTVVSLYFPVP